MSDLVIVRDILDAIAAPPRWYGSDEQGNAITPPKRFLIEEFDWSDDSEAVIYEGLKVESITPPPFGSMVWHITFRPAADVEVYFAAANPAVVGKGTKATSVDEAGMTHRVYPHPDLQIPVEDILEVRVGCIPWRKVASAPRQGEWAIVDLADGGKFQLGDVTLGGTVRCDVVEDEDSRTHREWRALNDD